MQNLQQSSQQNQIKKPKEFSFNLISKYRAVLMGTSIITITILHHLLVRQTQIPLGFCGKTFMTLIADGGVEIFLMLSGLGCYYSFKKNSSTKTFWLRHFPRILIPYFIFVTPFFIAVDFIAHKNGILAFFKDLTFYSNFSQGNISFWYPFLILFCYILMPFFFELFEKSPCRQSDYSLLMIFFTFFLSINLLIFVGNRTFFYRIEIWLQRFFPFVLGVFFGKQSYHNEKFSKKFIFVMILSAFLVFIQFKFCNIHVVSRNIVGLFCVTLCALLVLFLEFLEKVAPKFQKAICKFFGALGKITYELYLSHLFVQSCLNHFGLWTGYFKFYALELAISVLVSVAVHFALKPLYKVIDKKLSK